MPHLLNFVPTHGCRASLDSLTHFEDYGCSLQSRRVLLHSVATTQSTTEFSIMGVDEEVVDSPVTRAPILERLNSPSPVWPRLLPQSPPLNWSGCTSTKCAPYDGMEDVEYVVPLKVWFLSPSSKKIFMSSLNIKAS